jgi:hypothetical protein
MILSYAAYTDRKQVRYSQRYSRGLNATVTHTTRKSGGGLRPTLGFDAYRSEIVAAAGTTVAAGANQHIGYTTHPATHARNGLDTSSALLNWHCS